MKNTVNTWIEQIRQDHRRKLTLAMVLAAFAILVAGVVFWQLHTTGVAMSNEVYCGMEEHVHDESCYEQVLTCGLEESEGHVHDDSCFETVVTLVCTDDSEEHVHTEECYETEQILTCGLEESEGHTHTDACYETVLTCQIPEHTHTIDCMVDETADVETAADWEATLPEELSEDIAENIAAVAESQIGYKESEKNFILAEDGETRQGYTRYGAWYGNEYGDWDAMFASFCLNYAGISEEDVPYGSGAWSWMTALGDAGLYEENAEPAAGDLVFLDTDGDCKVETVAVVTGVSDVALTVVQGNSEDAVEQYSLYLSDDAIIGYSDPASRVMPLASTVLASGTIDNAEGEKDAISWVLEEDEAGNRTLTISGDGAIPDCSSRAEADSTFPWQEYKSTATKIVITGNITRIGSYSFNGFNMTEIEFLQETDLVIGDHAFQYGTLTSVHFPGTVKEIEACAFEYTGVKYIEFDEGVETIGNNAFGHTETEGSTDSPVIYIPASLTSIGTNAFTYVSAYVVAEDNPAYCADEDGVLYSKDMTVLVDYPKCREAGSWTVPDSVKTIRDGALNCVYTSAIYILNSEVKLEGEFSLSGVQRVYFADGVQLSGKDRDLFYASGNVVDIRLPENTKLTISAYGLQSTALTSLKIPNGTVEIGTGALTDVKTLETLYYDAENAELASSIVSDSTGYYDLIIGADVDVLPENFGNLVSHATSLSFIGENVLYITPGELDNAPEPYTGLSGWIYVDENGVIYQLDPDTGTATLYYIPESATYDVVTYYEGNEGMGFSTIVTETVTSVTVPATISVGEITVNGETISGSFTVTTVASDAAKDASGLTSITFENASAVTLEDYALAYCPLESVTDQASGTTTAVEKEAEALFKDTGHRVFYNTELEGAENTKDFGEEMDGAALLEIEGTDESGSSTGDTFYIGVAGGTWQESEDGNGGGYTLLTGEQLTVEVITEASDSATDDTVYRVYFQFTDEDGMLLLPEGTEWGTTYTAITDYGSYTFKYCQTDDPLTYYLELDLFGESTGTTIMFDVGLEYPVPTSGGGVTIWGEIAEKGSDAGDYPSAPEDSYEYIQAYWDTDPVEMTVTKNNTNNQTTVSLTADADGVYFADNLTYTITTSYDVSNSYGKDYVEEVTYEDILTLPAGVTWDAEVLALIEAGEYYTSGNNLVVYMDNARVTIATVQCNTSGVTLSSAKLSVNDKGDVVLSWTIKNSGDGEIPVTSTSVSFTPAAFDVDPEEISTDEDNSTITNTVTGTVHYTYADTVERDDTAEKTITVDPGTIILTKSNLSTASFFGEDWTYALTVSNPNAMPWTADTYGVGQWSVSDTLDANLYISAANMEKMFEEAAEDDTAELTITIKGAELGTTSTATAVDGETEVTLDTANSDITDATAGNTITITCSGTAGDLTYSVSVNSGTAVTGNSLQDLLDQIGYGVTYTAQYSVEWTLGEEDEIFSLRAGESHVFTIYSTVKDTFQQLAVDNQAEYGSVSSTINSNIAYLNRANNGGRDVAVSNGKEVFREAQIQKAMENLTTGTTTPNASSGDVLQYTLSFEHSGDGVYEDLPMVDDLEGDQLLLVPVKENKDNPELAGLETMTVGGTDYYILTPGTYSGVYVGLSDGEYLYADSITVEENADDSGSTGYHTQIKWYFSSLSTSVDVTYLAVASYGESRTAYSIGNTVWMNDKTDDRIFSPLWGGGTSLGYEKDIVVSSGTDPDKDELDDYSRVQQGEEVTYRLTLVNDTDGQTLSLGGANMADSLPATYDAFEWSKDNVKLSAIAVDTKEIGKITITADGTTLYDSGDEDYTTKEAAETLDEYWSIGDTYYSISGCYMLWDSNLTFTFENECTLYLYVTLIFPSNDDGGSAWTDYARDAGGNMVYNTLYINRFSDSVSHDLAEPGEVLLQKGVYALARSDNMAANVTRYAPTGNTRDVFNNSDSSERYVIYYVTLYNGGNARYYLSDITDSLPDGLTFVKMVGTTSGLFTGTNYNSTTPNTIDTVSGIDTENLLATVSADSGVVYRSAHVEMISANTTGEITFSLSAGNDFTYVLQYDEEREMYYLDRNEAVVFGYMCSVGSADETGTSITNSVSMDYTDYLGMGLTGQISENDVKVSSTDVTYSGEKIYGNSNDGGRNVVGELGGQQSLTSSVELTSGEIQPGVEKNVDENTEHISGTESVNWTTRLTNGGEAAMINYTYTDTMQAPFVFEGDMNIVFYGGDGNAITDTMTLFTIGNRSENDDTLTVTSNGHVYRLEIDGDPIEVTASSSVSGQDTVTITVQLSISRDSNGYEVMTLVFEGESSALQENGGYLEMTYSSRNPGETITSGATYVNTATLTPTQSFERMYKGSIIYDNGIPVAVTDTDAVTVTLNSSTSAWKSVTEVAEDGTLTDNTGSTSSSKADTNKIVLEDASSTFEYSLCVQNDTSFPMTKLVLLDDLPYEGDTCAYNDNVNRYSEYAVLLASPDVTVTVTTKDGTTTTLDPEYYTVQVSETKRGNFTAGDHDGTSDEGWELLSDCKDLSSVESIRVIIEDVNGELLPEGATVSVSFTCRANFNEDAGDDQAKSTETAWNNFGYHFILGAGSGGVEMEAMPMMVGVEIPSIPELLKTTEDLMGEKYEVTEDTNFTFVIYEGDELKDDSGNSYKTLDELLTALEALKGTAYERDWRVVTLTVEAGESVSDTVVMTGSDGLREDETWWKWVTDSQYTIVEFNTDKYTQARWEVVGGVGSQDNSYTFTYDSSTVLEMTCSNIAEIWKIELTKVDSTDDSKFLSGAVFALYSPNADDQIQYDGDLSVPETFTGYGGRTFYLCSVETSDEEGLITWNGLERDYYYVVEIKAPDGYILLTDPIYVQKNSVDTGNIIELPAENTPGAELPMTGGTGTTMIYVIGAVIAAGAVTVLIVRRRRAV